MRMQIMSDGRGYGSARYAVIAALFIVTTAMGQAADAPATQPTARNLEQLPLVALPVGRSNLIRSPIPIRRVSVTDPKVADIQVISPTQVLVSGKGVGATDLILWSPDEEARSVPIVVGVDPVAIRADLAGLLPNSKLDVRLSNNVVIVSGTLSRADEAESLHKFLETSAIKYVDMTVIPGLRQVQIKVVIAEANRVAIRALGVNAGFTDGKSFGASNVDLHQFGLKEDEAGLSQLADFSPTSAVTLFGRGFIGATAIEAFVSALAENQYARVLAEPTLVANSGQEASFLAGGEFPVPVVQGGTLGGSNSVTIEYKEFGVRLKFRPTVLGESKIRLHVAPEVSQLSTGTGAVQIQGFSIPAILTRRAETTLEMNSGQTFAMAGLINQDTQARSSRVPALGDLPILGDLFRSTRYQQGDTELVLLVTAALAEPESMTVRPPIPGMSHVVPNDWELYLNGQIEGDHAGKVSAADAKWMKEAGLGALRGPGAWTTYDTAPAAPQPEMSPAAK